MDGEREIRDQRVREKGNSRVERETKNEGRRIVREGEVKRDRLRVEEGER